MKNFKIECSPSPVVINDELFVRIHVPKQPLGDPVIVGGGDAILNFSTGETKSLDLSFKQSIEEKKYQYQYKARRISEYPKQPVEESLVQQGKVLRDSIEIGTLGQEKE